MGSELSFSQCVGQGRSTYRFVKRAVGWELVSRAAKLDSICTPPGELRDMMLPEGTATDPGND